MKNKELARIFDRIADALEFQGDNTFKIIAYRKAARVLDELSEDIEIIDKKSQLHVLPGVGKAIAEKIHEYLTTGKMKKYEQVKREIPGELLDMLRIQNLGPRTLALAHSALGVKTLAGLKKAIRTGTLAALPQMGAKKVMNIQKGIEHYEKSAERLPIDLAVTTANAVISYLKQSGKLMNISVAGSLRRWKETIGDIDILVTSRHRKNIINLFTRYPKTSRVLAAGETKASIIVEKGVQVDLRIVPPKSYGAALQYFTGSKSHNIRLRNIAKSKGMKLSEYGIFHGRKAVAGRNEEDVYKILGLPFIPPEMREDRGEIEKGVANKLPRLVELKHIKGDLHLHSTYSDSEATIEELARQAITVGYHYILIADHSASATYAHGLTTNRLSKQWQEIDRLNKKLKKIVILKGIEVDILKDGSLDYPDRILKKFDLVIASIHQGFKSNVTQRMCAAMANPYVDIIAHPTGRLISKRAGYEVDINIVMQKAATSGTWLELNAYPDRLDLSDINLKKAKTLDIKIAIGSDSHDVAGLTWLKFGVATARRGWLSKSDVVNTRSLSTLLSSRKMHKRKP